MTIKQFKFKKTDNIGAVSAEQDSEFLSNCFVDTGDLAVLADIRDPRQILLGRAGAGKTALLEQLKTEFGDQVITIEPENLALTYISNSTILQFFSGLGVNLDPFFKLLWRHVLTVEILKRHFSKTESNGEASFLIRLKQMFSGESLKEREAKEAIQYLQDWGENFWKETEFRVKEISKRLENSLNSEIAAELGVTGSKAKGAIKSGEKLSEEQKSQLVKRGQEIVSKAQVQDLHKVIKLLDVVLSNKHKQYYVIVDSLDENWVEEKLRYRLIMALILTSRDFYKVNNAKVIIALRRDLIERVFKLTRDSGFQEEKFQSLYLPLKWTKKDLVSVLDKRVNYLVARRYTKQSISHIELLPKQYHKIPITEYICRITERPRDIVSFFNSCILAGVELSRLKSSEFKNAEGEYSRSRLRALGDEWNSSFPALIKFTKIFQRRPPSFKLESILDNEIQELCLDVAADNPAGQGVLQQYAMKVVDLVTSAKEFKILLAKVYFRVGLVGLKTSSYESEFWIDERGTGLASAEIDLDTNLIVHPMYHRALGLDLSKGKKTK